MREVTPGAGNGERHLSPVADVDGSSETEGVKDLAPRPRHTDPQLIAAGATLGALAVVLGAFGAHALKSRIDATALGWWQTAVEYQMWHALAVLGLGLAGLAWTRLCAWMLAAGVLVFSGTLYAMALGAPRWLGAVTPLGGLTMILGWALLGWRASRRSHGSHD